MKLYEISENLKKLEDVEDVDQQTMLDTIEAVEGEFEEKGKSIIALTANWQSDIDAIDAQIKRLSARKKAMENKRDSLRDYLRVNMEEAGISKIECPLFAVSLRKPRSVVVIDDLDIIPDEYVSVKVTTAPNKASIKEALKSGADVPGARLEDGKSALVIK